MHDAQKRMSGKKTSLWEYLATGVAIVIFMSFMIAFAPLMILPHLMGIYWGTRISYLFMQVVAFCFTFPMLAVRYNIINPENLKVKTPVIFVVNHQSLLDTPALIASLPHPFKPLAKVELNKVPIFGWIIRFLVVSVDRKSPESRRRSYDLLKKHLRAGISILIFPEGSMRKSEATLLDPFKRGAFSLAAEFKLPIVPIVIEKSNKCLAATGGLNLKKGTIDLHILPAILPSDNAEQISEEVREAMLNKIKEVRV